ncbi:GNAT family N-acetyltransferase [Planococcus sp. YIM B11945]|uniref:GNAT family N-acetyltransferase n=1 Tax=Planococcus sp. YIM B11945 TaxID=3435410 RepID=UPI003D7E98CB
MIIPQEVDMAIRVFKYEDQDKEDWDAFVERSKNATFLHKTDYFHYHKDRFDDCSLLLKRNGQILALLPGNIEGTTFYSHKGMTYGGMLLLPETEIEDVVEYFNTVNRFLQEKGIERVVYKAIPHIYADVPSQEDEYALFQLGANLISCGISTAFQSNARLPYHSNRKKAIKRAHNQNLEIRHEGSLEDFWPVLEENLQKTFSVKPVHTLEEIKHLKKLFPDNIKVVTAYKDNKCVSGLIMYLTDNVAHLQYSSASPEWKKIGVLDLLLDVVINEAMATKRYFDCGVSVENNGHILNEGLLAYKEGFGGRGIVYQQYEYLTANQICDLEEGYG